MFVIGFTCSRYLKLTCLVRDWHCHFSFAPGYYNTSGSSGHQEQFEIELFVEWRIIFNTRSIWGF